MAQADDREDDIEMTAGHSDAASGAEQSKPLISGSGASQPPLPEQKQTPLAVAIDFAMCFGCLQTSYLIWGEF